MQKLRKADYAAIHAQLLPQGLAWPRGAGSVWNRLLLGFSAVYAAIDQRLADLALELDPRRTSEMLEDWERFAGLPDECSFLVGDEQARQLAVSSKLTATGGATAPYFEQLAENMGYAGATVQQFPVSRFGRARFGARLHDDRWRIVWQLNVPTSSPMDAVLHCRIQKLRPAHTIAFVQTGA